MRAPPAEKPAKSTAKRDDDATEILPPGAREGAGRPPSFERSQIGEYVLESILGEGGGGTVFAARHRKLGHRVAIKILRTDMVPLAHLVTRFNREVEAINKISHPNIVQVIEWGETERGQPYYVMELLEGHNLRELLHMHGRFTPFETLQLIEPICAALQAAHEAGFIHRDIKGSNVIVVDTDDTRSVKLLDFGIAKMVHGEAAREGLTEPGARLGSVSTMPPEQIRCERLDARADIYALGVLIYQLLTGDYPFNAEDPRQIAIMHLQTPPPRPSSRAAVSPAIDAVVLRCLEKSADRRFTRVDELLQALRAAVADSPPQAADFECQGIGVYVRILSESDTELDDAMIESASFALDAAEECLAERGFLFPLRTAFSLLSVRVVPPGADAEAARTEEPALVSELESRFAETPEVRIEVSVRVGGIRCRSESDFVGGDLLDLSAWTAEHRKLA